MSLINKLAEVGLTVKEAKIYMGLLKLKDASAVQLSKEIDLAKTTTYDTLESMRKKGLVSVWKKNNISFYSPESPNKILKMEESKIDTLKQIIPELNYVAEADALSPSARLYVGKAGAKKVLDEVIEKAKLQRVNTIYSYIRPDSIDYLPVASRAWIKEREAASIKMNIIRPEIEDPSQDVGYDNNDLRETRILSDRGPLESSFYIYGGNIALFYLDHEKMYSLIIESPHFTNTLKGFFDFMWNSLEATSSDSY
jgi:sugar-specific transcriptional regulator TrmB